jgi:phage tail sheath protein FI
MPEYLSPGVYVEEVSFRAKFIEGVSTSTCGIVGQTSFGEVSGRPDVVTSFADFRRRYGGWEDLVLASGTAQVNLTAHAVRAFFDNGGQRIYVARVFKAGTKPGYARLALPSVTGAPDVQARYPGSWGNRLRVEIKPMLAKNSKNLLDSKLVLRGVYDGAMVQTAPAAVEDASHLPAPDETTNVRYVSYIDGKATLVDAAGANPVTLVAGMGVYLLELQVAVFTGTGRTPDAIYSNLSAGPRAANYIGRFFDRDEPTDATAQIAVVPPNPAPATPLTPLAIYKYLLGTPTSSALSGGDDGALPGPGDYAGNEDDELHPTGLMALGQVDDISIVLSPDAAAPTTDATRHPAINNHLLAHCEKEHYRFAILDEPKGSTSGKALDFRSKYDSSYAGIYYPWVDISDPREGQDGKLLRVPPSGAVAGIYARTDVKRGVWKAPANEPVIGALDLELHVNKGVQDVLNPRAVNCLRFFEEGGFRVWGARTMSADPEWKYVNVRRLFLFLEHSIDRGTQWVVFEPNNERTWHNVRATIESFLFNVWNQGALMGTKPEEAFFVRCDRTTMTQNDLDNGRLVCQIGVAPAYPAEFVIFRIGQWTADSKTS